MFVELRDYLITELDKKVVTSCLSEVEGSVEEPNTDVELRRQVANLLQIVRAKEESKGLSLFIRSLVGLDREVAKQELARFISGKKLNSNQIEFAKMIVDYLTQHGVMDAALLSL